MKLSQAIKKLSKQLVAGSYDDFLTNYAAEIKTAINQLKEMSKKYDEFFEKYGEDDYGKMMVDALKNYDKNVEDLIDGWLTYPNDISIRNIAESAIDNMNRYGTEMQMILYAIEEVYYEFKKRDLQEIYHKACWKIIGRPGFKDQSNYSNDQGFFVDEKIYEISEPKNRDDLENIKNMNLKNTRGF